MQLRQVMARSVAAVGFLLLAAFQPMPSASADPTPAAQLPPETTTARSHIQDWMIRSISSMPDDTLRRHGVAAADVAQAKACAVRSIMADIPDDAANHIDAVLSRDPPVPDDVVKKWVVNFSDPNSDRHRQVMARVQQFCPQFQKAFETP